MRTRNFIAIAAFLSGLLAANQSASAATKNGFSALALAALVAVHSPVSNTFLSASRRHKGDLRYGGLHRLQRRDHRYHSARMQADLRGQDSQPDRTRRTRTLRDHGTSGSIVAEHDECIVRGFVASCLHDQSTRNCEAEWWRRGLHIRYWDMSRGSHTGGSDNAPTIIAPRSINAFRESRIHTAGKRRSSDDQLR